MVKTYAKKITAFMSVVAMLFSMLLYFPGGTFSNISFGLKASAAESTNDFTLSAVIGDPSGNYNEKYTNLFDGNTGTKWCFDFSGSAYVIFKASEPVKVRKYSIATGNDTSDNPGRNPVEWKLSGCINYPDATTSWTEIDTVTDSGLPAANETYTDFTLSETTPFYQYFKLEITKIDDGNILQISEIALKDCTLCEHQWTATGEVIDPTCIKGGYYVEYCPLCQGTRNVSTVVALGHNFVDGVCTRCGSADTTTKEPSAGNGVYQIGTAAELYWFANYVNSGNTSAKAVLTENITVNSNLLGSLIFDSDGNVSNGTSLTSWTPIGNSSSCSFTGAFDGQGHTISGLYFNDSNTDYVGLFGIVESGGSVSNVGVVDSYFNGRYFVGGLCGHSLFSGTITNCYNKGAVSGTRLIGGVCGQNNSSSTIKNCYNTGLVSGSSCVGGVCGNNAGPLTNCYYLAGIAADGVATSKTKDEFNNGEVAYLLSQGDNGSVWGQTLSVINKQDYPVLGGTKVYQFAKNYCDGTTEQGYVYANGTSCILHKEYNNNGLCTKCSTGYQAATYNETTNSWQISNAGQLYWFAGLVSGTLTDGTLKNRSANAVLTADIVVNTGVLKSDGTLADDTSGFRRWTPIGFSDFLIYTGTFDGQGHTVSGLYFNDSSTKFVGLFGCAGTSSSVSNVGVVDSYFNGNNNVGGVCGYSNGKITNCYNTGTVSGSNYVGGVCGEVGPDSRSKITNCYNTGIVKGTSYTACVVGYSESGKVSNCYYYGEKKEDEVIIIKPPVIVGPITPIIPSITTTENNTSGTVSATSLSTQSSSNTSEEATGDDHATCKTLEEFASGEVAYLLNGSTSEGTLSWGQTIGEDDFPVLDGAKRVYKIIITYCDGSNILDTTTSQPAYFYSNISTHIFHMYNNNGFCTYCGVYEPAIYNETANCYEISNAGQLYWFADKVSNDNANYGNANAVLTADIVVNENVLVNGVLNSNLNDPREWTPIGNSSNNYTGIFDGANHTIKGLYFNNTYEENVGLFGVNSGTIKNLGVVDSYFNGKQHVGGVCGYNYVNSETATATITNCYNTGTISGTNNVGGVCGYNYAKAGTAEVTNCYNTGAVSGSSYVGGVCGVCSKYPALVDGPFASSKITNCYFDSDVYTGSAVGKTILGGEVTDVEGKATAQFNSGEVAYLLNGSTSEGTLVWGQDLSEEDSYPVLNGAKVNKTAPCVSYTNSENTTKAHTDDDKNGICDVCEERIAYIVKTESSAENGDVSSVANLSGGGNISVGSSTTIKATAVPGYTFLGWYNGETLLSSDLTFEYTPEADVTLTAKYKANEKMTITIDGGRSYTVSVNGGEASGYATSTSTSYEVGTKLTVKANDDNFAYWQNEAKLVISRNPEYTFTVVGNMTVTAVYNTKVESKAIVNFISGYDQIINRYQIKASEAFTVPEAPVKTGCDFAGWSINGTVVALTADDYNAAVKTAVQEAISDVLATADTTDDVINVKATYTAKEQKVTVTVNSGSGSGEYNVNDVVTVTANAPEIGYKFSHWTDGNGTILSYNTSYSFFAAKDITVEAFYVLDTVEVEAKGTTEIIDVIKNTTTGKISFVSMSTVPEYCSIVKTGIVATSDAGKASNLTDANADYVRGGASDKNACRYTWTKSNATGVTWYVRAYLVYTDKNGNSHAIYSNSVVSETL